ncbi:hypothetical protein [Mycolicibacterium goodii]
MAIKAAAELAGLKPSAFLRAAGLELAKQLLPADHQDVSRLAS